ncbi:hypothetical protein FQV19_0011025, partial [Eudyptula minor]
MAGPRRSRCSCIRGAFSILSSSGVKRRRRRAIFCTKFLDAYCGYSEDGSLQADCGLNFTSGEHQKGIKPLLMHSMPEAEDLGDVFHLEDPQLVLTPGKSVLLVTESHRDIYMEPENDFQTPVEITGKDTAVFPSKSVESYELPQKSRTTAESEWPRLPECPSPMEIEPSGSVGFLESSITAAQLPEWDGDMCEQRANVSNSRMHW